MSYEQLVEKWTPVLNAEGVSEIGDRYKKSVTAQLLENQEIAFREEGAAMNFLSEAPSSNVGNVANWNPVLISLVRRAMPNMVAYDICGVQPMTGPTGLIFAMKSRYRGTDGGKIKNGVSANDEALFNEAAFNYSGDSSTTAMQADGSGLQGVTDSNGDSSINNDRALTDPTTGLDLYTTAEGEGLGESGAEQFAEMGFSIEKATVTAKTRALKAEYSMELAQDLKAIHGLDAETELANILTTEILAEINREVVRRINSEAKTGASTDNTAINGIFDLSTDADGRWSVEKIKGLILQMEREANQIAKDTRRGRGNFILCSSDVASALAASGMLDYAPAMNTSLNVDDTGNTFAGVLNGRTKVYIDPYATVDYVNMGYKGTSPYDAGLFYCPYVPLTMVRAVGENTFQPKIGFKTRYGMVPNPFVTSSPQDDFTSTARSNQYYRIFRVDNILQ